MFSSRLGVGAASYHKLRAYVITWCWLIVNKLSNDDNDEDYNSDDNSSLSPLCATTALPLLAVNCKLSCHLLVNSTCRSAFPLLASWIVSVLGHHCFWSNQLQLQKQFILQTHYTIQHGWHWFPCSCKSKCRSRSSCTCPNNLDGESFQYNLLQME